MKRYRIWMGNIAYFEAHAHSKQLLQEGIQANFGRWIPEHMIEEVQDEE